MTAPPIPTLGNLHRRSRRLLALSNESRHQLWQTDFTYLKITGWAWYYLSTLLDELSRFIVACKLCAAMKAKDVTAPLDLALATPGLDQMTVVHRARLLSDNGALYVAEDLAQWLDRQEMEHVRGAPYHPKTQGEIERWHQTLNARSPPSWRTTTMPAITRASTILPRLTSTSDALRPSSSNAKGLSARQSPTVAWSTTCMPHILNHR